MSAPALFRPRVAEIRAVDLGDGRHVILGESPRYISSAEFHEAFELVPERRAPPRQRTNGRGRGRKTERRKGTARRHSNGDLDPRQARALELLAKGEKPVEVAKKVGAHLSSIYLWKKRAGTASAAAAPARSPVTHPARKTSASSPRPDEPKQDGGWMQ